MLTDQTSGRIRELAIQIGDQRRLVSRGVPLVVGGQGRSQSYVRALE